MLQDPEHASVRPQIIGHLGTLLSAHLSLSSADSKSLALIKDELISILASASQAPTTAIAALHVLAVVCRVPHFLSAQEKSFVVSCFNDNLKPDSDPEVAASALVELSNISDIVSRETCERTLPQLFSQLPDTIPSNTRYTTALNALAQLCTPTELFESLVIRVLGRLDQAAILNEDLAALYCHHLLVTLRNVVMKKLNLQHPDLTQTRHKLLPRLFGLFLRSDITDGCWKNPRLCLDASDVITLLVQSMATE